MSAEKIMNINERRKYLGIKKKEYDFAGRTERGALLSEMAKVTGLHRKSILRLFRDGLGRRKRQRQRGRTYGATVGQALLLIAESLDYPCAERLKPVLLSTAQHLEAHHEISLGADLSAALQRVSIATVRRIIQRSGRNTSPLFPRVAPSPPNPLLREVPMRRIPWQERQPGHFEVDLVQHSGPDSSGDYAYTLQMIDVATGWSARRALLGRGFWVMQDAFRYLLTQIPFPVLEIHPDNGAEFFNYHLMRFWQQPAYAHIQISRSRPYHKNDNRFVEQKNYTLVRAYFGPQRFDTVAQTQTLNHLYEQMNRYYNLFQPVLRLSAKEAVIVNGQYVRSKRHYEAAQTPLARLFASKTLTPEKEEELQSLQRVLNPRSLRQDIYTLIGQLRALPNVLPGHYEDVYLTLAMPLNQKEERTPR